MATVGRRGERRTLDYYDNTGKRQRKTLPKGTTLKKAKELLRDIEDKLAKGTYLPDKKTPLFKAVADDWLVLKKAEIIDSTWGMYEQMVRLHLVDFHDQKINMITKGAVEIFFANKYNNGMCLSTLGTVFSSINQVMEYAVTHGYINQNPAIKAKKPKKELEYKEDIKRFLTVSEINAFLGAVTDQKYYSLFRLGIFSGARQGELLGLKWTDVDWFNNQIHIQRTFNKGKMRYPKTKSSRRKIDIGPGTMEVLKEWMRVCPENEGGLVFPNNVGKPMNNNNMMRRYFYPALEKAGIERIRFHDLRHTYASLLINKGQNIKYVQNQLGHSTITTTVDKYGHLMEEVNRESARGLEEAVFNEPVTKWSQKTKRATESRPR